ncbi:MAG: LysR family transcriptional regulator [Rhodocyclaceae bacterium]|nr:LysR family transcriptional regulator [Rhodocyclaceae bacterium]
MKAASFAELEFFVLLNRLGSLSAAARALDITPPAATMRLASMEKRIGARLLNRSTRKISLTPEGEIYLAHAERLIEDLRELDELVSGNRRAPRGLLRVNAPLGFGRTVIAPLVSRFTARYPEVETQLEVTDRPIDLIGRRFDLAIRFGELPDNRINARRIMSNRRFLCASPLYLERHGTPNTLAELARHRCIVHRQNDDAYGVWRFVVDGRSESVKVHGALSSNDGDIVQGWALDGQGIVIRSEWDVTRYLESGRLRRILPDCTLPSADLYAYYPSRTNLPARVRVFIDFLVEQLAAGEAGPLADKSR